MPRFGIAQWTGIAVTVIVVLGNDLDVIYAVPLGLLASGLAAVFSELPNLRIPRLRFARIRRA